MTNIPESEISVPKLEDTAIAKLDKLLDEYGIKHYYPAKEENFGGGYIEWRNSDGIGFRASNACFSVSPDEFARKLIVHMVKVTPEQAIAATLGDEWVGKPFVEYVEHVAKEVHSEAFALLEGCDEPDFSAIDAICAACEDVMRITDRWKRGESQDEFTTPESATLGQGTLTAEDVRSFLNRNSVFDDTIWRHGRQELVFDEDDLQAMADELNATLGRGTCHDVWQDDPFANFKCSECNEELHYREKKRIACCPFCKREVVS